MSNRHMSSQQISGQARPRPAATRRRPLTAALLVALALPGFAFAQTAKEVELEARVAELEKMVQQLVSQQQSSSVTTAAPPASAPAPVVADGKAIQATTIVPSAAPGTAFSFGGFIKLDAMATDTSDGRIADGSAGRLFYVPSTIPVGDDSAEGGDAYTDVHAQFSRFWLAADHVTDAGDKVKAYIEADMYGGGSNSLLGNETSTNTYGVSLRHAYVSWNNWLAGQTWSNFQDTAALPDSVDFVGPTDGVIFVRQAQLRYTSGPWSFSLENPQTTVTPYLSGGPRFNSGDNIAPDATARWITKGDWGHFTVAGLLRQFKAGEETATGGALSASGKFNLGASDDIRYAINGGSGIGRYLAFGMGTDVVQDADGDLEALDGYGGYVAWRHVLSPKLRGNLMYSAAHFDNDVGLMGQGVTERAHSLRANLIYSPFSKLDIGAELSFGQRFLEDDREGDLSRLHTTVKYSF